MAKEASWQRSIPIKSIDKNDPPAFMVVGTRDRLVPLANSVDFGKLLKENGVSAEIFTVEGGGHVVGKQVVSDPKMQSALIKFVKSVVEPKTQ